MRFYLVYGLFCKIRLCKRGYCKVSLFCHEHFHPCVVCIVLNALSFVVVSVVG